MDDRLRRAAARRYEVGRWHHAVWRATPALGVGGIAALLGASISTALLWSAFGFAWIAFAFWRRERWGRGARAGVLFSGVPLLAAAWMQVGGHCVSEAACQLICVSMGVGGGAIWGLMVARRAKNLGEAGLAWAAGGATLVALIGCTSLAVGSVGGVVVGLLGGLMAAAGRPLLSR